MPVMRRLVMVSLLLPLVLAMPFEAKASTITSGTILLPQTAALLAPEQAAWVAQGCASPYSGVFVALVPISAYRGQTLSVSLDSYTTVPGGFPDAALVVSQVAACAPDHLSASATNGASKGHPAVIRASGNYLLLSGSPMLPPYGVQFHFTVRTA